MNCGGFKANFSAYFDGELRPEILAAYDDHLGQCGACTGLLKAYRTGVSCLSSAAKIDAPDNLFERVMAEVNEPPQAKVIRLPRPRVWAPLAAAAVVLILTYGIFNDRQDSFNLAGNETLVSSTSAVRWMS